ncbi:MAG: alpha/beta fold hydrolase [Gammaproteobacteria bacterium]
MIENPYYSQELHGPYEIYDAGIFEFEEGGVLPELKLAYAVHGKLNADKTNAILFPTWYSGTSKVLEQLYIGEGRALDPGKYCVICINQIGSGLSSSPHNTPAPWNMAKFPRVRIGDDVRAQHQLLTEHFGIETLELVVGGSMGAQQVYEWAVRYPEMVKRAAAIAGYAKNTDHDFLYTATLNEAIKSDPGWNNGWYSCREDVHEGLRRQSKLWSVMGLSTEFFAQERWRDLGCRSLKDFQVGFMEGLFTQMDPNDLLCMAWKWQRGDVSRHTGGDLRKALKRIAAKTFVMPIDSDMFFKVADCRREQKMIKGAELRIVKSIGGHFGLFGFEPEYHEQVDGHLKELLATKV